ncbi:uncharacterized protein LOC142391249 [Odontesthes bonariensis]|uniref:uncharacterized protein LOC142391249 n=1 Tax=Odontesthes bonariensis TaxID=219752 RepID=UPI003F58F05B
MPKMSFVAMRCMVLALSQMRDRSTGQELPSYKQLVTCGTSTEARDKLQDCMESTDWESLRGPQDDNGSFADTSASLRGLRRRKQADREGDMDTFRLVRQYPRKAIKSAKEDYRGRLERDSGTNDPAVVWRTLRTITNYNGRSPVVAPSPGLADHLNTFYTKFERPPAAPLSPLPSPFSQKHGAQEGSRRHCCKHSGKVFKRSSHLRNHHRRHTGEKPYNCGQCGAAFTALSSLKSHQRIHTGEKPYSCDQCEAAFTQLHHLKMHQRIHTGEKPYSCGQCGAVFSALFNLKTHQRIHTGEKPYSCGQCGAAFTQLTNLRTHQRIHTGEKPYSCGQCGAVFAALFNLKTHQRIHTGEKPYSCGQCGAAFTTLARLKTHQHVHTGEKPYSCGQCGAAFSALSSLKRHQYTHFIYTADK